MYPVKNGGITHIHVGTASLLSILVTRFSDLNSILLNLLVIIMVNKAVVMNKGEIHYAGCVSAALDFYDVLYA